jgi:hypothetical protein
MCKRRGRRACSAYTREFEEVRDDVAEHSEHCNAAVLVLHTPPSEIRWVLRSLSIGETLEREHM